MHHSTELHRFNLHRVENDTKARAFCGPTSIAAVTGQPISIIRDACRMVRHGAAWPSTLQRAPNIKGLANRELEAALRTLGYVGRWVQVPGNPTLAAWLDNRTVEERRYPCIVNVTRHYVAVSGYEFVDTFSKGEIVDVDEAPHRRKRVKRVFIVTAKVAPTPVVSKQPASIASLAGKPTARRAPDPCYREFVRHVRSIGATWHKERGDDELEIRLQDGRCLIVTHSVLPDDWRNAQIQLEDFLSAPTPDPDRFEDLDHGQWAALFV